MLLVLVYQTVQTYRDPQLSLTSVKNLQRQKTFPSLHRILNEIDIFLQVRHTFVQEAEICLRPTQSQPEDHLQRKLQIRGPGKISCQPRCYGPTTKRGILEVRRFLMMCGEFSPVLGLTPRPLCLSLSFLQSLRDDQEIFALKILKQVVL